MTTVRFRDAAVSIATAMLLGGCAGAGPAWLPGPLGETSEERTTREHAEAERDAAEARARAHAAVPRSPLDVAPAAGPSTRVWTTAVRGKGTRIVVSVRERALWLMHDTLAVFRAPVAVGMNDGFTYQGKRYFFETPVGTRKVSGKSTDPLWVPPDWHYFEKSLARGLEPVQLRAGRKFMLADGTHIEVRGDQVGRVNQFGNFAAFTPGNEIIFDRKIFIPPIGSAQRRIPEVLGTHKLEIGDGYLIHGTDQATSIGEAVSHGCVRMYNEDVAELYARVPVGTPVYLY